jgi:STE24 endopeptidase
MRLLGLWGLLLLMNLGLWGETPKAPPVPEPAKASAHFDAKAATDAWLATMTSQEQARSNAYFEGGYWLILWDFLYTVGVMALLLETKLSARLRDWAEQLVRAKFLQAWLYWIGFSALGYLLSFPLTIYEGYFREHQYGLSNLSFSGWFGEQMTGLGVSVVLGGLAFGVLVAVIRRLPGSWHIWGALVGIAFLCVGVVIGPVFIAPLFNKYKPLENQALKQSILSLARANGIPATDVYEVDASKQSKRVSANVSGFLGTERITLNDNLLARCSPQAILAVMGHEMGHYVLHHIYNAVIFFTIVIVVLFWALRHGMESALARWGERWSLGGVSDVAALPLAVVILSILGFLFTPISNSFTRTQEFEADLYGLNAARQPDGEAEADMLLGEYRKMDPGPLEEMIFFDHPSGRTRIYAAMRWKAENLCLFDASLVCTDRPDALAEGGFAALR